MRRRRDAGMATAEIAMALPALVLVAAIVLWGETVASVRLACSDAARSGARAAARGESLSAVRSLVERAVPRGARVTVRRDGEASRVEVAVPVPPPVAAGLPALTVTARAVAATEPGADSVPATDLSP
ncbi:hypothetical protein BTM25_08920 [Actinomadura rubteroloni]|uniref:Pilus assembly protein TadE n=1 Tax=Actinomadura rubteroloni TaxID=1926885 RepID=A0A2P4UN66_9ACTN|nr:TadE family type IV pilus minor pilin [Actinomadura rubteroloni]POM26491.1 hypothetical protein BTM25_08920 [Actinomadura rubteroloni]